MLLQHVVEVWFPRSLDLKHGGFLCDFDRAWRQVGSQDKFLEFQARHTLFCAEAVQSYPERAALTAAMEHGFRYLRETMWDSEYGGWFHLLARDGTPLNRATKHSHGAAYGILACAAVYGTTGRKEAMDLARAGFEWLDDHARDHDNGGYWGRLTREGEAITSPDDLHGRIPADPLGTDIGLKDINVHSDVLEALMALYAIWPERRVMDRITELILIIVDRLTTKSGLQHYYFEADFKPIPDLVHFGYQLQNAFRLNTAVDRALADARVRKVARLMLESALARGWDRAGGGFFAAGPGTSASTVEDRSTVVKRKVWWVQAEGLKALISHWLVDQDERLAAFLGKLWKFIAANLVDHRYGGWYYGEIGSGPRRRLGRLRFNSWRNPDLRKGTLWKDASHEGRALMLCAKILKETERRLP